MSVLMSVALMAAAVSPAMPVDARDWFTSKEFPKTALAVGERGQVSYTIDVAPDGKAIRCQPVQEGSLDRKVCEIVMKNARFLPARDENGAPAFGVHYGTASFLMPGKPRPERARLVASIDRMPDGVRSPAYSGVVFRVDATGAISDCASVAGGEGRRFQQNTAALAPVACEKVSSEFRPASARDAAGVAVPSIQTTMVRFDLR